MTIDQAMQLGLQHHQAGRLGEAEQLYRGVLRQFPLHPEALHLLGMVSRRLGHLDDAARLIRQAMAINPASAAYHSNLGIVLVDLQKFEEAVDAFTQAIRLQPGFAQAYCNLGSAHEKMGQLDQAIDAFSVAIRLNPQLAEAHSNLGNVLSKQKKFDLAIASLTTAVAINRASDEANYNLGHALRETGKLDEAADYFNRAIQLNPANLTARCDLGSVLHTQGKPAQEIEQFSQAIAIDPNHATAHWNLSLVYLLLGNFDQGWAEHEWRMKCDVLARPAEFAQPRWQGEPLNGQTILLHPEQGFGDALQFVRYAPWVAARGGRVVLQCRPALRRLLENSPGVSHVVSTDQPLPDFELHCPLMSLAFVLGTRLDSIPTKVPYLFAEPSIKQVWEKKLGERSTLRVGLVWAGSALHKNDTNRSLPLALLEPLFDIAGARFFSLQKGEASQQIATTAFGKQLIDHTPDLTDFAETAGLIANLDLIITVDTAVAHLAGGMAKPVWVLLPHAPDWRWLLDREDSPWYPTMRLFRQPEAGDWSSVVQIVVNALSNYCSTQTTHRV